MSKIPIFPITQPPHFTDYGFEPQIDYFQALEEARKQKRESTTSSRSIDQLLRFKLQKPISKDDSSSKKIKKNKKRWWRNPLLFFKFPRWAPSDAAADSGCRRQTRHRVPGPVYITESRSGSSTPYRTTASRAGSGEEEIPYISLRELNMDHSHTIYATSPTPIYLVT